MAQSVINNETLISEEKLGYGSKYLVQHETVIQDPRVREKIAHHWIKEVIS